MTVAELAKKSGVHYTQIHGYVSGNKKGRHPNVNTLVALARALRCSLEDLTGLPQLHGAEEKIPQLAESTREIVDFLESLPDDDTNKQFIIDLIKLAKQRRESHRKDGDSSDS